MQEQLTRPSLALWNMPALRKSEPGAIASHPTDLGWSARGHSFGGATPSEITEKTALGQGVDKTVQSGKTSTGQSVVISTPKSGIGQHAVRKEAHILDKLSSTGVAPRLMGAGNHDGEYHITEHLGDTHVPLKDKLTLSDAPSVIGSLPHAFESLAKVHDAGYVHNDFGVDKSEHVWLPKQQGQPVKFIDFGNGGKIGEKYNESSLYSMGNTQQDVRDLAATYVDHFQKMGLLNNVQGQNSGTYVPVTQVMGKLDPAHQAAVTYITDLHNKFAADKKSSAIVESAAEVARRLRGEPPSVNPFQHPGAKPDAAPAAVTTVNPIVPPSAQPPISGRENALWQSLLTHKRNIDAWKNAESAGVSTRDAAQKAQRSSDLREQHLDGKRDFPLAKELHQYADLQALARQRALTPEEQQSYDTLASQIMEKTRAHSEGEVPARGDVAGSHQFLSQVVPHIDTFSKVGYAPLREEQPAAPPRRAGSSDPTVVVPSLQRPDASQRRAGSSDPTVVVPSLQRNPQDSIWDRLMERHGYLTNGSGIKNLGQKYEAADNRAMDLLKQGKDTPFVKMLHKWASFRARAFQGVPPEMRRAWHDLTEQIMQTKQAKEMIDRAGLKFPTIEHKVAFLQKFIPSANDFSLAGFPTVKLPFGNETTTDAPAVRRDPSAPRPPSLLDRILRRPASPAASPAAAPMAATRPLPRVTPVASSAARPAEPEPSPREEPLDPLNLGEKESEFIFHMIQHGNHRDEYRAAQHARDSQAVMAARAKIAKTDAQISALLKNIKGTPFEKLLKEYHDIRQKERNGEKLTGKEKRKKESHGQFLHRALSNGEDYDFDRSHDFLSRVLPAAQHWASSGSSKTAKSFFGTGRLQKSVEGPSALSHEHVANIVRNAVNMKHAHIASWIRSNGNDFSPSVQRRARQASIAQYHLQKLLDSDHDHPLLSLIRKDRELTGVIRQYPRGWTQTRDGNVINSQRNILRESFANQLDMLMPSRSQQYLFPLNRPWHHEVMEACHPDSTSATVRHWAKQFDTSTPVLPAPNIRSVTPRSGRFSRPLTQNDAP